MGYNCRGKCHYFPENIGKTFSQKYEISKNQKRCRICGYVCDRSFMPVYCPCCGCRYKFKLPRYMGKNNKHYELDMAAISY